MSLIVGHQVNREAQLRMKITIKNFDRGAILLGVYFSGAALGAVTGLQVVDLSPTVCALVGGVLLILLLPLRQVERFLHWGLVGVIGLLNIVVLTHIFLTKGEGITSLLIVAAPIVLLTVIASARG